MPCSGEVVVRSRRVRCHRSGWLLTVPFALLATLAVFSLRDFPSSNPNPLPSDGVLVRPFRRSYTGTRSSYAFNISPPNGTCVTPSKDVPTFVILVRSAPHHFRLRNTIRKTWGKDARDAGIPAVFVTGKPSPSSKEYDWQLGIATEAAMSRDVLQGMFVATYGTVPMLNILGLKWAAQACSTIGFLVKVSDDTYVNVKVLREVFSNVPYRSATVYVRIGTVDTNWNGHKRARACDTICVPCGYAISMDLVPQFFKAFLLGSFSSMEDLFCTSTRSLKVPVRLANMPDFAAFTRDRTTACEVKDVITSHQLESHDMEVIWSELRKGTGACNSSNKKGDRP